MGNVQKVSHLKIFALNGYAKGYFSGLPFAFGHKGNKP